MPPLGERESIEEIIFNIFAVRVKEI